MASPETTMSQEEKEALLNNRIEEIRRKNAALQKRYEEVQADKKNADGVEAKVRPPSNRPPREIKEPKQRLPIAQRLGGVIKAESTSTSLRQQRLKQEDGPPPDPSYSFLADRTRGAEKETIKDQQQEEPKDRHEGSRRHPSNYGGKDFSNAKVEMKKRRSYEKNAFQRRSTNSKMEMELSMTGRERSDYERWRYERKGIDEARVNRQRTTSGEWGRQWDKEKDFSKDAPVEPTAAAWKQSKKQESRSKKSPKFHASRPSGEDDDFGHLDQKENREYVKSTDQETEIETEPHSPLNRSVDVSNDTLSISFTNDLVTSSPKTTQMSDDVDVQATAEPQLPPPPPPIPPRVKRGWGSDDAWEDASPWEDCEDEHSQELVDDTFEREEDGEPEVTTTIYETRSTALETDDDLVCKRVDMAPSPPTAPLTEMEVVATDSCVCNDTSGLQARIELAQMQMQEIESVQIKPEVKTGSDDEYKQVDSTSAPQEEEEVNEVTDGDAALPVASLAEDMPVLDAKSTSSLSEERQQIESTEPAKVENLEESL